jgi:DNA-binding CsgD family transcriptional regulator
MHESLPAVPQESVLIEALCEVDTSAWCFLPSEQSEPAYCSQPFRSLWDLPPATADGATLAQSLLAEGFERSGVPADEFFDCVTGHGTEVVERFQLRKTDGTRIQMSVRCVFSNENEVMIGRLLMFQVVSETNAIAGLVEQISDAQRQLQVLSKREMEILDLVYEGRTNKAISIATGISEKTVEKHRSRIMLKLGLSCTPLLIRVITLARMLPDPVREKDKNAAEDLPVALHAESAIKLVSQN